MVLGKARGDYEHVGEINVYPKTTKKAISMHMLGEPTKTTMGEFLENVPRCLCVVFS